MTQRTEALHEWRIFFERASAKGGLQVQRLEEHASRWAPQRVAEFLDLNVDQIGESNNDGYQLLDFDIAPSLPDPDGPEELRAHVAAWLSDGYRFLRDKGRRRCSYRYYERYNHTGNAGSAWTTKLSELTWVPCDDDRLRCPRDVLPTVDPTRSDAPVARLSSELLSVLDREGVKFGSAIPEATSLRKLSAVGSQLSAEELAHLLADCREEVSTDTDRRLFDQALQCLMVPSSNGPRIPLDRIVKRHGGRLRGSLGGWTVPLDRIDGALRIELEHSDFPRVFPDTTTGHQALDYIEDVWKRARSLSEPLANEVRDVLPTAYAYCLEDCAEDTSFLELWTMSIPEAVVFDGRQWIVLAEGDDIYFDDIEDRRFLPSDVRLRTATSGHLGRSRDEQLRTADAIGLPRLSSSVNLDWRIGDETLNIPDGWGSRFDLIWQLLQGVRKTDRVENDETGVEAGVRPVLVYVPELAVDVRVDNGATVRVRGERPSTRGQTDRRRARPVEFGPDSAKELAREFSLGQRGDLAADLTGMLAAIDDERDFGLAVERFRRSNVPEFELPRFLPGLADGDTSSSGDKSTQTADVTPANTQGGGSEDRSAEQASSSDTSGNGEADLSGDTEARCRHQYVRERQARRGWFNGRLVHQGKGLCPTERLGETVERLVEGGDRAGPWGGQHPWSWDEKRRL